MSTGNLNLILHDQFSQALSIYLVETHFLDTN